MTLLVDVGIIAIIRPELDAVRRAMRIAEGQRQYLDGDIYWRGVFDSHVSGSQHSFVLYVQGEAGNTAAGAIATKVLERHKPRMIVLTGIAAGIRGRVRLGDTVGSLAVADQTLGVLAPEGRAPRPSIDRIPHSVRQMCTVGAVPIEDWHALIRDLFPNPVRLPPEPVEPPTSRLKRALGLARGAWRLLRQVTEQPAPLGANDVAIKPQYKDGVIRADNSLLRDRSVLQDHRTRHHQQTLVGEMEAAGVVTACQSRTPETPWFVIRGVADFGDESKSDDYHVYASVTAAAYMALWLRHVFDLRSLGLRPAADRQVLIDILGTPSTAITALSPPRDSSPVPNPAEPPRSATQPIRVIEPPKATASETMPEIRNAANAAQEAAIAATERTVLGAQLANFINSLEAHVRVYESPAALRASIDLESWLSVNGPRLGAAEVSSAYETLARARIALAAGDETGAEDHRQAAKRFIEMARTTRGH